MSKMTEIYRPTDEEILEYEEILRLEKKVAEEEALEGLNGTKGYKMVIFTSRSKGKGRKRKHSVEVELISSGERHVLVRDGYHSPIDIWANEALGEEYLTDEYDTFLERLRYKANR